MKKQTFWNACPRKLEYFPEVKCVLGKTSAETKGDPAARSSGCAWYVNSPDDFYCFWKWLRRQSNSEGAFRPLYQHEVCKLLKCSSSKAGDLFKAAVARMENLEEYEELRDYL